MDERASESNPLPLSSGIGPDVPIDERPQVESLHSPVHRKGGVGSPQGRRELDISTPGQVRVTKRVVPEPPQVPPHFPPRAPKRAVIDVPRCGACQRPQDGEKRRLP